MVNKEFSAVAFYSRPVKCKPAQKYLVTNIISYWAYTYGRCNYKSCLKFNIILFKDTQQKSTSQAVAYQYCIFGQELLIIIQNIQPLFQRLVFRRWKMRDGYIAPELFQFLFQPWKPVFSWIPPSSVENK